MRFGNRSDSRASLRDTNSMDFYIEGKPIPLARHRTSNGRAYDAQTKEKESYQKAFLALHGSRKPHKGPLELCIEFSFAYPGSWSKKKRESNTDHPRPIKPDLSNLIKFVEDALNGFMWEDDSQIVSISARKYYSDIASTYVSLDEKPNL